MNGIRSGRFKTFDEAAALQQAIQHCWLYDYSSTSISDLMHTMGIFKASLYQTFFNKKALFLLALHRCQTKNHNSLIINTLLLSMQSPRRSNPDSQIKWEQL